MSASNTSVVLLPGVNVNVKAWRARRRWEQVRRSAVFLLALTASLIVAADLLFYHRPIGWTLAIFAALVTAAMLLRSARCLLSWPGRVLCLALLGLGLTLIEHPGPLRITMTILALLSIAVLNKHAFTTNVMAWIVRWSELAARMVFQAPCDLVMGRRWRRAHGGGVSPYERLAVHWVVPLALSLVFIALFAAANPIISSWISRAATQVGRFFADITDYIAVGRVVLWVLVGCAVWALLRGRTRAAQERRAITAEASVQWRLISESLLIRCLALFNVVFAVQLALDLTTVLSAGANLPEGMTYSEYARRGAYPLVATALLAAGFVLMTFPSGQRHAATRLARWLTYFWIGQNIVLTGSAVWRLWMYVDAFGLTRLRVAAAIWMLLVALGLTYIIWRIVRENSNAWLLRVNVVTLIVVLYVCCFVNFDRIIAWHGVEKSMELRGYGPRVDLRYLRHLGLDAIPTLEWLALKLGPDHAVGAQAASHAHALRQDLDHRMRSWHGWTLRRHSLAQQAND